MLENSILWHHFRHPQSFAYPLITAFNPYPDFENYSYIQPLLVSSDCFLPNTLMSARKHESIYQDVCAEIFFTLVKPTRKWNHFIRIFWIQKIKPFHSFGYSWYKNETISFRYSRYIKETISFPYSGYKNKTSLLAYSG